MILMRAGGFYGKKKERCLVCIYTTEGCVVVFILLWYGVQFAHCRASRVTFHDAIPSWITASKRAPLQECVL